MPIVFMGEILTRLYANEMAIKGAITGTMQNFAELHNQVMDVGEVQVTGHPIPRRCGQQAQQEE